MTYRIEWNGTPQRELEPQLRQELDELLDGDVEGLIFHTMMVGGADYGSEGPSVGAHWCDERECLVAEFCEQTEWMTLSEGKSDG